MNGYIAILNGKKIEVYADSLYQAKQKAIAELKPRKRDMGLLSVMLAEKNGEQVTHTPTF